MTSIAIKKAYSSHRFNRKRIETDTLFALPAGSVSLEGKLDYAIRFIEDFQLLDTSLWKKFAEQFRNTSPKADDADNGWRGEYWGKMMRGACFTYQYTKNPELYSVLASTVRDMMSNADEQGRISTYSVQAQYNGWDMWCRKYVMLGMEYFIEICEDEAFIEEIKKCLMAQADYLVDTIGYESEGKVLITKTSGHWKGMNSSSILEPIVRLYNLTGEQKYFDFATYIIDCGVICDENVSIFEMAYADELELAKYPVTKAYEMMSCFEGLLEYYRITGIEKWKQATVNFARRIRLAEISVIGSCGCTHELFDNTAVRQANTEYNGIIQETCVTVTYMKLCFQLLSLTGDSVYADEIERSVYNALLGAINFDKHRICGGLPFDSYSPLLFNNRMRGVGGQKYLSDGSFYGCCACIGSAGTGLIGLSSALLHEKGIVINTYSNAIINTENPYGENIGIKVVTDYPVSGIVNIEFTEDSEKEYSLFLRIPEWSKKSFASLNGECIDVKCGEYVEMRKAFKKGDYITLSLDMRARLIYPLPDPDDKNAVHHVAIKRGPLMLARDSRLSSDIEEVVHFTPDADGCVECEIENTAKFDKFITVNVKNSDKINIAMIDYASAGRTWDDKSITTVWLPTVDYWTVDFNKEITITSPNMWGMEAGKYPFIFNSDGLLAIGEENTEGEKFALWSTGDDRYLIRAVSSGQYLVLTPDNRSITLGEKGIEFSIKKHAQNRYRIAVAAERLEFIGPEDTVNTLIKLGAPSCEASHVFRFEQ